MNIFLNFFSPIETYSILLIAVGIVMALIVLSLTKDRDFFGKILGTFSVISIAVLANNPFVYTISLIIVATLVTELEFLEKLMALIWNREKYWDYLHDKNLKQDEVQVPPELVKVATELKTVRQQAEQLEKLVDQTVKDRDSSLLQAHFEKTYRLIFGSQLNVLFALKNNGNLTKAIIEAMYRRTPHHGIYPFENYIGFLLNSELISFNQASDSYSITPLGNLFLNYLNANNISLNKAL